LNLHGAGASIFAWQRLGYDSDDLVVIICNLTPQTYFDYALGVPRGGYYRERLNTDATIYGGSGQGNAGGVYSYDYARDGHPHTLFFTLPPLAALIFEYNGATADESGHAD